MQPAQEPRLGAGLIPCIRAFRLECVKDTGVHRRIAQQEIGVGRCRTLFRETGQRHAPGALARQHPIGPRLDHRIQPVAPGLGRPLHQLVDRGQRTGPDRVAILALAIRQRPVDGCEPLRAVQPDHRCFGPPAMGIGNRDAAARQKPAQFDQLVDHRLVGAAGLAIFLDDPSAREKRQIGAEGRIIEDVPGHRQPMLATDFEIIVAMGGCGMDKARACVIGDMIAGQQRHVEIPFAIGPFGTAQRVGTAQCRQLARRHTPQAAMHRRLQPHGAQRILGQLVGDQVQIARLGPAFAGCAGDLIKTIGDLGPETDRAVLRQGPGRGGPDHHLGTVQIACRHHVQRVVEGRGLAIQKRHLFAGRHHAERHPDRIGLTVVIFHLGLGQRGLFDGRPHHGF